MKLHPLVLLASGVAAAATACGGSSSGGSPAAGATTAPTTGSTTGAAAAAVQHPKSLIGEVGEDDKFLIELHDENDKPITDLAAGSYALKVEDYSAIHDFHLTGNGVDKATTVPGKGTQTFQVTFSPGTYTFVCDPHAATMKGSFTVS